MITSTLISKIEDLGFTVFPDKMDGVNGSKKQIYKDTIPTINEVLGFLELLKRDEQLFFWDKYHKTISDPGAYDTVIVIENDTVAYKEGNHGWSSDWKTMCFKDMAERIIINWIEDMDCGDYKNQIILEDNRWNKNVFKQI